MKVSELKKVLDEATQEHPEILDWDIAILTGDNPVKDSILEVREIELDENPALIIPR